MASFVIGRRSLRMIWLFHSAALFFLPPLWVLLREISFVPEIIKLDLSKYMMFCLFYFVSQILQVWL